MTLSLTLNAELEQRLEEEARRYGVVPSQRAVQILETHLEKSNPKADALERLMEKWSQEPDDDEKRETPEHFLLALDEQRPEGQKLFPPEMKGISW